MEAKLELLIQDYWRRIKSCDEIIDHKDTEPNQRVRVLGKKEAYRTFIAELKQVLKTGRDA